MNWNEFFAMGGYAFYVWTSWGLTAVVMLVLLVQAKMSRKKIQKEIRRQISREQKHLPNS
jgi:heme exporter protein D